MGSSSPSLKSKLSCLLDPQQQQKRQSSFSGDLVKIRKVPSDLRERSEFNKYYFPRVVSIGPIHHPKGEEYKEMWATTYVQEKLRGRQEDAEQLLNNIRSKIQELKECYTEDVIHGLDDDELAWILFVDGCAALYVMQNAGARLETSKLQKLYNSVQQDLVLLENQLPYQVLRILSNKDDSALKKFRNCFLETLQVDPPQQSFQVNNLFESDQNQPAHLLHLLITSIVAVDNTKIGMPPPHDKNASHNAPKKVETLPPTHRNIQELVTAGIQIRKSNEKNLTWIYLSGGVLYIPPLIVDDFTAQIFMNMIAYEMCPDNSKTKCEISNYVSFLNSLIDHANDVKALSKAKVLTNHLHSDEEVAILFNIEGADLGLEMGIYDQERQEIEKLCNQKCRIWLIDLLNVKNWLVEFHHKHFNTPWKIIGLISFILGFVLTVVNLKKELDQKEG